MWTTRQGPPGAGELWAHCYLDGCVAAALGPRRRDRPPGDERRRADECGTDHHPSGDQAGPYPFSMEPSINFSGCSAWSIKWGGFARLRADAAGSANHSSMDVDVNRADKRALCQLRKRAAASNRDIRGRSQSRRPRGARPRPTVHLTDARRRLIECSGKCDAQRVDRGHGITVKNQPERGLILRFDPRLGESVSGSVSRSRTREETSFAPRRRNK